MTNKLKRTLIVRYIATPIDVLNECVAEIYAKRSGELFKGEKPRSYNTIAWDLFLKVSQLDKFLEMCEKGNINPGYIQEMIEADPDYLFYGDAKFLYDTWLLPSYGACCKSPHRERNQRLVKDGKLTEVKASMNPILKEMQILQRGRTND